MVGSNGVLLTGADEGDTSDRLVVYGRLALVSSLLGSSLLWGLLLEVWAPPFYLHVFGVTLEWPTLAAVCWIAVWLCWHGWRDQLPLRLPLFLYLPLAAAVYGLVIGLLNGNSLHRILFEFRYLALYLLAPVVTLSCRSAGGRAVLVRGALLAGSVSALLMVLIQFDLLPERVMLWIPHKLIGLEGGHRTVGRSQPLVLLCYLAAFSTLVLGRWRMSAIVMAVLTAGSLLVSLARNMWIGMLVGSITIALVGRRVVPSRVMGMKWVGGLAILMLAVVVLGTTGEGGLFAARLDQMIGSSVYSDPSMIWRLLETEKAIEAIRAKPLLGHGLGARYHDMSMIEGLSYYVHNDYLFAWLKLGLPGLIAIFASLLGAIRLLLAALDRLGSRFCSSGTFDSSILFGGAGWLVSMALVAIVRPVFVQVSAGVIIYSLLVSTALHRRFVGHVRSDRRHGELDEYVD
jgi:O-antigen ligase